MGTSALSISKSVHASVSLILLHKSCSMVTTEHSEPLLLENHIGVVALQPDLQRVSIHSATELVVSTLLLERDT